MTDPLSGIIPQAVHASVPKPTAQQTASTQNEATSSGNEDEKSLFDQINDVGFRNYVEEMQKKKLEELREKILQSMGLDEESLAQLPGDQRNQIEDMITKEISARMQAAREMEKDKSSAGETTSQFSGIANTYQISIDGQRISANSQDEKSEPMIYSFFA